MNLKFLKIEKNFSIENEIVGRVVGVGFWFAIEDCECNRLCLLKRSCDSRSARASMLTSHLRELLSRQWSQMKLEENLAELRNHQKQTISISSHLESSTPTRNFVNLFYFQHKQTVNWLAIIWDFSAETFLIAYSIVLNHIITYTASPVCVRTRVCCY